LQRAGFGRHITAVISGNHWSAGDTFHLYGKFVGTSDVWEIGFINKYDPRKRYRADHVVQQPIPDAPTIVVTSGTLPPVTRDSPAYHAWVAGG
jgi:hypothetical protein